MISREFFAGRANAIINHDDVRPFVVFDDTVLPMDLGRVLENEDNVLLMAEHGGFLFVPKRQDLTAYELHTFFLKEGRGRELVQAAHEAFEWMFLETPARKLYTYTPDDCPHARPPISFGWRSYFWAPIAATRGGRKLGAEFWRLDIWDWAAKEKKRRNLGDVLRDVARNQRAKAEAMAAEWREWSGDEICL